MLQDQLSAGARLDGTMPLEATLSKGAQTDFPSHQLQDLNLNPVW